MKKHNFEIDIKEGKISVEVTPGIFPMPVIMSAAYHFIDDADVIIDGDPSKKVIVNLILNDSDESNLERLGYEFNIELINSFLKDLQARRYMNVRNAMIQAALSPTRAQRQIEENRT